MVQEAKLQVAKTESENLELFLIRWLNHAEAKICQETILEATDFIFASSFSYSSPAGCDGTRGPMWFGCGFTFIRSHLTVQTHGNHM